MENDQSETQKKLNQQQTPPQKLAPGLEAIVTAHLTAHPTLTREKVLAEIEAAGF